ncbi:MAG: type II toxin-antitoxin system RelE/ParE family toxin [Proteobacteria bacterium]|nr:type II toxin-antitoxin system RelE/ParE family toxin [Pseudomonadota bacterium]
MIKSFRHKGLKQFLKGGDSRKLPPEMVERLRDLLTALNEAEAIEDLVRPSFRLHSLRGGMKGVWAVTVRANWRITFRFESGHAFDVDFQDYH